MAYYPHPKFDRDASKTFHLEGTKVKLGYLTGNADGIRAQDKVNVGGIIINSQDFFLARNPDAFLKRVKFDGILGLGIKSSFAPGPVTVWENMVNQKLITRPIFSVWLRYYKGDGKKEDPNGGQIVFGGFDPNHFLGEHAYVPMKLSDDRWKIKMSKIYINGKPGTNLCDLQCTAVVDSGTTDIYGPEEAVLKIYAALEVKKVTIACRRVSALPDIHFTIGGKDLSLTKEDYILDTKETGRRLCSFRILKNTHGDFWLLGEAFMTKVHTVFDYGDVKNPKIGFAEARQEK